MSKDQGHTRKEFLGASVLATGAAAAGVMGFNRMAQAQDEGGGDEKIIQIATINLNPEQREEGRKAIANLVTAVEEKEPDVLMYIAHEIEDENKIFFYEVYKNQAALDNHSNQPHMQEIRQAFMSGALALPLDVKKLDRIDGVVRA